MAIFDFRFHHPNPWIDDLLHGDHTHTNEDGEEVISPGTPDRPVVIEPDPEPDPAPNPNPGPDPDANPAPDTRSGDSRIAPLTKAELDALTKPSVTTGGRHDGGSANEFIFDGMTGAEGNVVATYGTGDGAERLYGGGGNDVLVGGYGDDYLNGGPGNDYLFGGRLQVFDYSSSPGNEHLSETNGRGGGAANILHGGPGNDYLESGGLFDLLDGGPGNDHLASDNNALWVAMIGGPGRDVFDVSDAAETIKILDFQDGADKILLGDSRPGNNLYGLLAIYNLAADVGVRFDMAWIADEVDNGVTLTIGGEVLNEQWLTINGARLSELQLEVVGDDIFIA